MMKRPPYQWLADAGSIILVVFVVVAYRFFPQSTPSWAFTVTSVLAVAVLVAVITELTLMFRDYRAGYFFPMRNASLFMLLLSLAGIPLYLLYAWITGLYLGPATLLLIPVFLTLVTRNLFRVRLDSLSLRAKTGFRSPREVPLFKVEEVSFEEDKITIHPDGQPPIQLLRVFFFPVHWKAIRTRLTALYEAAAIGSDIVNMSWGVYLDKAPEALECAVKTAVDQGIYLVTSAGNDTENIDGKPQWPAAFAPQYPKRLVTTASYWYKGNAFSGDPKAIELIYFSNFGPVTVPMAGFITTPVPEYQSGNIIYPLGTSITAPIVTGALMEHLVEDRSNTLGTFKGIFSNSGNLTGEIRNEQYLPLKTQINQP